MLRAKRLAGFILVAFVAISAACIPEKRIVWSPDGSRAAVIADDGLRLCRPDGALTPPLMASVRRAAWFADGQRLAVVVERKAPRFGEVEKVLSATQRQRVIEAAGKLRQDVLDHKGAWDSFEPRFEGEHTPGFDAAAVLYLRDHLGEGLAQHVGEKWADIEKLEATIHELTIVRLDGDRAAGSEVVVASLDEVQQPEVGFGGQAIAFLQRGPSRSDEAERMDLLVVPARAAQAPRVVAGGVAFGFGWSPDGQSLAYLHGSPTKKDGVSLGALATARVADGSGLLAEWSEKEDRVGVLFNQMADVEWLRDGTLIFSAVEVSFPATVGDMPQRWTLFGWSPSRPASVTRLLGRSFDHPVDPGLAMFAVSPSGRHVALPGPQGRVTVVELSTGSAETLVDRDDPDGRWRAMPVWRNDTELCVISPPASAGASSVEVVLAPLGGSPRCLSVAWPVAATADWLSIKRGDAATTRPAGGR